MIGIKFPTSDKGRWSTIPLDVGIKTTFGTTKEIIEFFEAGYNTFFITDKETFRGKIQKFKQGDSKDKYITQSDLSDDKASVIGLDFDRHILIEGKATNIDKVQGLTDLSKEFGTVLYAPSKSSSDKIFSGRIFIFLNKRISKQVFRKYLELWAYEKYNSPYIINHHKRNALYFLTGEGIENTHISHEYIDRVAFNPSHKLNVYEGVVYELYHEGQKIWQTGDKKVPDIALLPRNVANRLQKFGKESDFHLFNIYNNDNAVPIQDILHPEEKQKIIEVESETARQRLSINGVDTNDIKTDKELLFLYQREFKEGEYPADGKLKRASDGAVKTASEWLSDKSTSGNFAYEPNIRKETGYLYIKNGRIFDYQGGQTTLVALKRKSTFKPIMCDIEGDYLPKNFYAYVMSSEKLAFCQAPTGSGKSYGCAFLKKTIFLVPTRALGNDLDNKEGFVYVRSSGDKDGDLKRIDDISSDQSDDTIVMTYDKFAYIYDEQRLHDYHIIVDEAHLLFSQKFDKFTEAREKLMFSMFNNYFRSVMLMSANPNFYEAYEPFMSGKSPRVVVYRKPKNIDFIIKSDFSKVEIESFKNERTIIYCNDRGLAAAWAEMIGADVISSEHRIMEEIDRNPNRNFVFTAVMREGYSFNSKVDNFIIDTRVNVITGANSVVQAASRARSGATKYYIRHSLGRVKNLAYKLSCISVPLFHELASIFYDTSVYTQEERDVIKYLPLYAPVAKAVSAQSEKLYLSNLVALSIEAMESYERSDINLMMESLNSIGYASHIEKLGDEVMRPKKLKNIAKKAQRKILKNGVAAYKGFGKISGKFLSGNDLKNKVIGLYNNAHPKKKKGLSVKTAVTYLRKVDVSVIPINTDKLTMSKEEFTKKTKDFTYEEMTLFMSKNNIKRGRGQDVWYWIENIKSVFENGRREIQMLPHDMPLPPSLPHTFTLLKGRSEKRNMTSSVSRDLIPPPPPQQFAPERKHAS